MAKNADGARAFLKAGACAVLVLAVAGCSDSEGARDEAAGGQGGGASGSSGSSGSSAAAGSGGGSSAAGGTSGAGATGGAAGAGGGGLPETCAEAAAAYTIRSSALDPTLVPYTGGSGSGNRGALLPVAIDAANKVYVGFTRAEGASYAAVVAEVGGATLSVPDAANGGVTATKDGVAVLLFDPNPTVDARTWAAVRRTRSDSSEVFRTDLFRSPNLDDVDTKGAPRGSRLGYIAQTDQVVAYFGHTQRYDDGVRHQGGYLATLDVAGTQRVLNGWFGSHNLEQRLLVDQSSAAVLGLGDAYPEGVFFSFVNDRPRPAVIYALAAAGNGAANGQLGGMVDLGDQISIAFITNRSIPQDLDAGTWPNIDDAIAQQIRDAAANGTDLGLMQVPKSGTNPSAQLSPVWLDPARPDGARLERLKAVRYGNGNLLLLAWAEAMGTTRTPTRRYFTMIVDSAGAVCQPKTPLAEEFALPAADDIVRGPDGSIVWANVSGQAIRVVTLTPG